MNRRFFVSLAILLFSIFSFSICLATDGSGIGTAANDVRNFVGGVEDTVENAASSNMNSGYSATRTTTDTTMGMSQNVWIWFVLGVAAIAIIAVVWYYSMQFTNTGRHGRNDDDNEN